MVDNLISAPDIALSIDIKDLGNRYFRRKTSWYIANVPLNIIKYDNWEPYRYKHNMALISTTKSVQPIILGDFDKDNQKYTLQDGNHRSFCSNELGYTHIPAIIHIKNKDVRFQIINIPI